MILQRGRSRHLTAVQLSVRCMDSGWLATLSKSVVSSTPGGTRIPNLLIRSQLEAVTSGSAQSRFVVLTTDFADWSSGLYPLVAACCLSFVVRMWSGRGRTRCIVWRRKGERLRVRPRMVGRLEGSSVKGGWTLAPGVHQWPSTSSYSPPSIPIRGCLGAGLPQRDLRVMSHMAAFAAVTRNPRNLDR